MVQVYYQCFAVLSLSRTQYGLTQGNLIQVLMWTLCVLGHDMQRVHSTSLARMTTALKQS